MAKIIGDGYYDYDGFVLLHGTDTMAYSASALSFMLEQLTKPVVITGSQRPLGEPISAARQHILGAMVVAGFATIPEVCVFYNGKLLRGNRSSKVDGTSLAAFDSPCYLPLAQVGGDIRIFDKRLRQPPRGRFRVSEIQLTQIVTVWVVPGFCNKFLWPLIKSRSLKAMILMLYGCGNAPARALSLLQSLRALVEAGVVVVACTQCVKGHVAMGKYAVGKAFADVGVVSAGDMTVEATSTKLAYLLSKGMSPADVRKHMYEDLRGELTIGDVHLKINEPTTGLAGEIPM